MDWFGRAPLPSEELRARRYLEEQEVAFGCEAIWRRYSGAAECAFDSASVEDELEWQGPGMTAEAGATAGSLTQATLGGVRWTYTSLAVSAVVQFVFTVAVSRMIEPSEFGLFATSMAVVAMAQLFGQVGLGPAVIQQTNLSDEALASVFWFAVLLSAGLSLLIASLASPLSRVLGAPGSSEILVVLSLTFLLNGIGAVPAAYLRRAFDFRRLALAEMLSTSIAYLGVGLGAAALGLGVWALVLSAVVYPLVRSVMVIQPLWSLLRLRLRLSEVRPLLLFGGTLSIVGLAQQASSVAPVIVMTRSYGTDPAGQYNRAGAIVQPLLYRAVTGFSTVLFPAFSTINRDPARLYRSSHEALLIAGAAFVPACAIGAAVAPEATATLLGPGWSLAADMLPWVLLYIAASLGGHFYGIVIDAWGAVGRKLVLELMYLGVLVAALASVGQRSPGALVSIVAVLRVAWLVAYALFAARVLRVKYQTPLGLLFRLAVGGAVVLVGTSLGREALLALLPNLPTLVLLALCGSFGTAIAVGLWWRGPYAQARTALSGRLLQLPTTRRFGAAIARTRT